MSQRSDVRRSQLINPFGPGALTTNAKGVSLICSGLNFWFRPPAQVDAFRLREWRLEKRLNDNGIPVSHFRLPPAFQRPPAPNANLRIPAARFPRWHFCPGCKQMHKANPAEAGNLNCPNQEAHSARKIRLHQVRFVAMCSHGHLTDFPWREWVHRTAEPACQKKLWLEAAGGATLASIIVRCDCGKRRSLEGITSARPGLAGGQEGTTTLSAMLDPDGPDYTCSGHKPWAGAREHETCGAQLRGSLRGASNLYYAQTVSSLSLPPTDEAASLCSLARYVLEAENLTSKQGNSFQPLYSLVGQGITIDFIANSIETALTSPSIGLMKMNNELRDNAGNRFTRQQLLTVTDLARQGLMNTLCDDTAPFTEESEETTFRRPEYEQLRQSLNLDELTITDPGQDQYDLQLQPFISRIMLVEKLRETRVLTGISRVEANPDPLDQAAWQLLWRRNPEDWLPANVVYGEGIFLEFNEDQLLDWEGTEDNPQPIRSYFQELVRNYRASGRSRENHLVAPRFVLLHTFAHLLINQLVFECGYSTASLRERLYVSTNSGAPMAGILIYTSAGDSDGTLGGLVRLGRPGSLEPIIRRALGNATWCAADPVCMEMADHGGQGPHSCNLAACHNCALLPETSCEEFNRFLDRGHVIGIPGHPGTGYFEPLLNTL